jgi:hypothetical protein
VNAENRLVDVPGGVKAVVTQTQAKLIFTLGAKTAMAFETSGVFRALKLFANLNFGMDFQADHFYPPRLEEQTTCQFLPCSQTEDMGLIGSLSEWSV